MPVIQELGLTDYKDSNSDIGKWLYWPFGLHHLNHEEVAGCLVEDMMSDNSTDEKVQKYVYYVTDTYIAEEAKFPSLMRVSDGIEGERHTTACEAFYSKLNLVHRI
ncbi:hypothetical protein AVEN_207359-1 [Araneus ventricosus]|uniref:Uncharacterized protein n=1 Tax=Araneus ventricosus TaxID=182803 RepID=A0A4Y2HXD5_ARAVE|nr:hypothetical protein AVEN_207359-1 [Araneus ventricosus]